MMIDWAPDGADHQPAQRQLHQDHQEPSRRPAEPSDKLLLKRRLQPSCLMPQKSSSTMPNTQPLPKTTTPTQIIAGSSWCTLRRPPTGSPRAAHLPDGLCYSGSASGRPSRGMHLFHPVTLSRLLVVLLACCYFCCCCWWWRTAEAIRSDTLEQIHREFTLPDATRIPAPLDSGPEPVGQAGQTTGAGRKLAAKRTWPPALRVSENELLPFSDFNVQQPAFSDLIKSWPPTTLSQRLKQQQQQHQQQQYQGQSRASQVATRTSTSGWPLSRHDDKDDPNERNHLNEDLDDTILTADQAFERDQVSEPPGWINYLGSELGDWVYGQLRALQSRPADESPPIGVGQQPIEIIDELLDDFYYDQYQNSHTLYYGAQLVREGDIFEVGCYLPADEPAEWTKSGRPLAGDRAAGSPRVVRRTDYLGAKQNFTLKVFEASLSDSGNYRCNRMSRKFHKLVVVPLKTSTNQLYAIQQRLLSVVNPELAKQQPSFGAGVASVRNPPAGGSAGQQLARGQRQPAYSWWNRTSAHLTPLLPGHLIVEGQPLSVNCNINDEFVLRRLAEAAGFQLAWYKNGKQLKGSMQPISMAMSLSSSQSAAAPSNFIAQSNHSVSRQSLSRSQLMVGSSATGQVPAPRIQFLQANGRQMYISSASYADAGEYLCSWSKLPISRQSDEPADDGSAYAPPPLESPEVRGSEQVLASNPLAAGSLVQLIAPVRLRAFRSAYHVRAGNELRLVCLGQRGYPAAQLTWYVGNQLVDGDFLRRHPDEFRLLQLQTPASQSSSSSSSGSSYANSHLDVPPLPAAASDISGEPLDRRYVVELNPILSGRKSAIPSLEYRDNSSAGLRLAVDTADQQVRYLRQKLHQLASSAGGQPSLSSSRSGTGSTSTNQAELLVGQASISILVVRSLDVQRHMSRFACRATTRANTDEVTTLIRVIESSTRAVRPSSGKATLVFGQRLHLQCETIGKKDAQYMWFKREIGSTDETMVTPNNDDTYELQNEKLILLKPDLSMVGDYVCRLLADRQTEGVVKDEFAVMRVRAAPRIDDFEVITSHTGQSAVVDDGDRLELTCQVRNAGTGAVNITWLRSASPDDERTMVPLAEMPAGELQSSSSQSILVEAGSGASKRLVIQQVRPEHRSYYVCMADNGVAERARKVIYIRVKDRLVALWPFLGILAELFILFTIIYVWETRRTYKQLRPSPGDKVGSGGVAPASERLLAPAPNRWQ